MKSAATLFVVFVVAALGGCVPPASQAEGERFLVYFDEFSAHITGDGTKLVAEAASRARDTNAPSIRIEGRASATGSPVANQRLAETRTQVVADELAKDGIDPATIRQAPVGQTGSGDDSVAERRVDIILER